MTVCCACVHLKSRKICQIFLKCFENSVTSRHPNAVLHTLLQSVITKGVGASRIFLSGRVADPGAKDNLCMILKPVFLKLRQNPRAGI